ncbi:hypothetical protein OEW28_05930 [Defluviimonas sp. WL0002]|uniref:Uncharacterized protein n=1 Tax=Albidovulum marisflavi TaxID=2984159 RepID=A0ABT2ZAL1_9RHOB|nr:hypothetical protein [Defluviimonas sp. WL0002]MCV2868163.1 hypothetical protein [Defluviimonas sp. WL0002]
MTDMPISSGRPVRSWFHHIPVLGWIAFDIAYGDPDTIWYALVILVTVMVLAVQTWGLVALAMTALAMVPVMFVTLILITLGK